MFDEYFIRAPGNEWRTLLFETILPVSLGQNLNRYEQIDRYRLWVNEAAPDAPDNRIH
jgi:hypothetical protein